MDVEEKKKLATAVLLATLCIPPRDRFGEDPSLYTESEHEGNTRLANLLGFKKETPTRARLITGLISSGVFEFVNEDVRVLYELSENKFGPLSLHAQVKPILERLMTQGQPLSQYVEPIQNLIVLRVIQQLATVFKSIRLDKFLSLVPSLPLHHIERLVMSAVQSDQVQLRMDHRAQLLHFSEEGMEGPRLRDQLSILARSLQRVADIIEPMNAEDKLVERQHVFHAIQQGVDSEHDQVFIRQQEIEKRKQESEREAQERERREQEQKARAAAERKREEQKRLADESARREQERQKREKEEKERQMKEKLAQTLKEQLAKDTSIDSAKMSEQLKILENPLEASKQDLIRAREEILQRQQYETEKRRKEVARRIDYMTRAMRIEEKELLVKQMELQKITDREQHEADFKKYIENAKSVHAKLLEDKKRLERMGEQRNLFHAKLLQRRQEEYEKKKAEYDKKVARRDAERARLERARDEAQAALDRYRQEKEEEERARREEEERLAKQAEEERALKEKIARDRRAKLEESAAKQRAREAEIEAKEAARRAALTGGSAAAPGGARPDDRIPAREEWRGAARDAPAPAAAAATAEKPKEERDWSKARRTDDEPPATAAASENRPWTRRGAGPDASRDRPTDRPTEEKKWRGGASAGGADRPERSERDWGRDRDRPTDRPERPAGEERWRTDKPRERDAPTERPWARRGEEGDAPGRDAPARGGDESSGGWRGSRPSDRSERSDRPERSERPTGDRWGRGREDERERERPAAGERPWARQDRDRDRPNKDSGDAPDRRDFRRSERPSDDGPRRGDDGPRRDEPRKDATPAEEDGFTPVGRRPAARR